jgi:hypothetical protein
LKEVALKLQNQFKDRRPTQEEILKIAANLKLADDAFILMGFATYYYGRGTLYPTSLGIDIIKQAVFRKFKDSIRDQKDWPQESILVSTNFGEIYDKIPAKIKEYGNVVDISDSDKAQAGAGKFVDEVIKREKLFDSETGKISGRDIKKVITKQLALSLQNIKEEQKDLIPRMVRKFMNEGSDVSPIKLTAQIAELFNFIKNPPAPKAEPKPAESPEEEIRGSDTSTIDPSNPEGSEDFEGWTDDDEEQLKEGTGHESAQMTQFLMTITDADQNQINNLLVARGGLGDPEDPAREYYNSIVNNLNHKDPHCIALLKHIYKNVETIKDLKLDPTVTPLSGSEGHDATENDEKIELLRKEFNDFVFKNFDLSHAWGWEMEQFFHKLANNGAPVRAERVLKKIKQKTEEARNKKDAAKTQGTAAWSKKIKTGLPGITEQRLTKIITSILETIIKEENGEKELCN